CDAGARDLARGDRRDQVRELDDLEIVVAHGDRGIGLEAGVDPIGGPQTPRGPRGALVVLPDGDLELADPAEVPGQRPLLAVDGEPVGVLLADEDPAGAQQPPAASAQAEQGRAVVLVLDGRELPAGGAG